MTPFWSVAIQSFLRAQSRLHFFISQDNFVTHLIPCRKFLKEAGVDWFSIVEFLLILLWVQWVIRICESGYITCILVFLDILDFRYHNLEKCAPLLFVFWSGRGFDSSLNSENLAKDRAKEKKMQHLQQLRISWQLMNYLRHFFFLLCYIIFLSHV